MTSEEALCQLRALQTRNDVAAWFGVADRFLCLVLYGRKERSQYTVFSIPKRTRGVRIISAPPKNLKIMQRQLADLLLAAYPPKPSAHGFLRGRSIVSNASRHVGHTFVLNIDLKDFFPEIHIGRFVRILQLPPYRVGPAAARVLSQIAFDSRGRLPQGAPSSPIVSNIICHALDDHLQQLARKHHCRYTRYADDLTFSTSKNVFPGALATVDSTTGQTTLGNELRAAVESCTFTINDDKVRLQLPERRQEVTGLTVNEAPNVQRRYIRELRTLAHIWRKYGYDQAHRAYLRSRKLDIAKARDHPNRLYHVVRGKLAFLVMVKGRDDPVIRRLRWVFSDLAPDAVIAPRSLICANPTPMRGHVGRFRGWQRVARSVQSGVLFVQVLKDGEVDSHGSAFVVGKNLAITAGHVAKAGDLRIGWEKSGPTPRAVFPLDERYGRDLAILEFEGDPFADLPPFRFQLRLPEVGEEVSALGFPRIPGRDSTLVVHSGNVEALPVGLGERAKFIQTSFPSGGGLSGGPLIDKRGYVLGLMVENVYMDAVEGVPRRPYGQAVPVEYVLRHAKASGVRKI